MYFNYSKDATDYLKKKDKLLGDAIEKIGTIKREVNPDLFSAVIRIIIGQQISTKAQETIWERFITEYEEITAEKISTASVDKLQSMGITYRKAEYVKNFAEKVETEKFNIECLRHMTDEEVIKCLSAIKGIGRWTAEMLMIFSMQRGNILSYGDLAIHKGMRMLYHHRKITPQLFRKYQRRYSPYGSVASLYLWAIAGGAVSQMKDYAPKKIQNKAKAGDIL